MKVIFGRNKLPFSWLIRIVTWSRWSHCGIIIGDSVIESTAMRGVTVTPLADFIARYKSHHIATVMVKDDVWSAQERAMAEVGKGYDFLAVIGILFKMTAGSRKRWFCSELVAHRADRRRYHPL